MNYHYTVGDSSGYMAALVRAVGLDHHNRIIHHTEFRRNHHGSTHQVL